VAAYQAGRLLNQLNWHCQLAVLISKEDHRQAIDILVTKLKSVSQEIAQDAPSFVEKQIDRLVTRFWAKRSSYWAVEYYENLRDELQRSEQVPDDYWPPGMTCEDACVSLADTFVEPIVAAIRKNLKRDFDSSERWAFGLGEFLDGGMRRADVYAFLNRRPPPKSKSTRPVTITAKARPISMTRKTRPSTTKKRKISRRVGRRGPNQTAQ